MRFEGNRQHRTGQIRQPTGNLAVSFQTKQKEQKTIFQLMENRFLLSVMFYTISDTANLFLTD